MKAPSVGYLNKGDVLFVKLRVERLMFRKNSNSFRGSLNSGIFMTRSTTWQCSDPWERGFSEFREFQREKQFYKEVKS